MSIILSTSENDLQINAWNWGVLHHLVECAKIFDEELWEPFRYNAGGELTPAQVATLLHFLENQVLPAIKPGERILANGEITDVPDDGTFYRNQDEQWKNYSLQYDVLVRVIEFLRQSNGAVQFY